MLREIFILSFLGINSWIDVQKKEISLVSVIIFAVVTFGWQICTEGISMEFFIPAGISCLFIVLSILTRGALGLGDGWLMLALGGVLETEDFLIMLFLGMAGSALWSVLLLCLFHKGRNTEVPFVPFLLLGYIGGVLLWK